ncbi:hypothetical protein [Flavobacterium sedimenticola]|uniref:Polysaccharide deacetylase n=1 Tax=Flavobacterium sedimenticola TaxID=3043286 RepID=A0ABT6XRI0_9FLAO|nr:hypothetical protein [Flavobacterium sedimenticola]MDI9257697.1 hypothetical protein [Flavobacterium sedimenticola]
MKQFLLNHIKNLYGWKTNRKIVVFSVDDYGNVRLDSKQALERMTQAGLKAKSRFDRFDTLETKEDLEMLYDTLTSVKDKHGHYAVFTPFALSSNIDFEQMAAEGYEVFRHESLPVTYQKLSQQQAKAYEGTWNLWQEGIAKGLMKPQFHGREHLNLKVFTEKLARKDSDILTALQNRSYAAQSTNPYPTINYTAAFDFWDPIENKALYDIVKDGLSMFEAVYGYKAEHFMPPTSKISEAILNQLGALDIRFVDRGLLHKQHEGFGKYKTTVNFTGKRSNGNLTVMVRNVVFEPTENDNAVAQAMQSIEAAFRLHQPAIISSHRVNFCGHIDPNNRKTGLSALNTLLKKIVAKWPDVEFMSSIALCNEIRQH